MLCLLNQSDQQDQLDQVEDELMRVDRNCLLTNSQVEPVDQVDSWLASRQFFRALLVDLQVDLQVDQVDKWTSAEGRWTDARWQKLHAEHLSSPPGDSVTLLQILVRLGHNCIHSLDGLIVALHIFATGKEGTNVHSTFCSLNLNSRSLAILLAGNPGSHQVIKRWPCLGFAWSLLAPSCPSQFFGRERCSVAWNNNGS